ncbi:major facilitator superfamily domain-containing protein [Circinella umbellata]|nr:major facilitator superfamily domain-containing protein [Circinella umbellata]
MSGPQEESETESVNDAAVVGQQTRKHSINLRNLRGDESEKPSNPTVAKQNTNDNNNNNNNNGVEIENAIERVQTNADQASVVEALPKDLANDIPDGGYGWAIAFAGFLAYFVMFGIVTSYGIFSYAYATSTLQGKATTLELMTVGSVINVSLNVFSPLTVILARLGTRFNYGLGGIFTSLGLFLASLSTEVWHLYLTQGVLFGFGCSFLYMSIATVIPQWFTTRRATAMGICSAGTGLGGLAISPLANSLIEKYGIHWAHIILGFFSLGVCALGTILIKDRLPRSYVKKQPIKSPFQFSLLKMANFDIWLVGSVIALLGYLAPLFYLPKYAAHIGLDPIDSSNLLSILSAMGAVGRLGLGYAGDKIGRLNMFIITSILSGIFSYTIWPFATSFNILLVYCILWGLTSGLYYALAAPITASVVGMDKLAPGLTITFFLSAIAAMGAPICAAIQEATPDNGYIGIQMFNGSVYICGALICLYLKYRVANGNMLARC